MLVRRTVRWLTGLTACLLLAAAAAAWHFAGRADGFVKTAVLAELRTVCPHGEITVRRAAFDWTDTVTLHGLRLATPVGEPLAEVPVVRLTLDRARYREANAVEVEAVTLVRPTLSLVRRHDGAWDAGSLLPLALPDPAPAAPRWTVEDATVRLVLETAPHDPAPLVAELAGVNLALLPDSRRSYRVEGAAAVRDGDADSGRVSLSGAVDIDRGRWRLSGNVRGLTLSGALLADAFARDRSLQSGLLAARETWRGVEAKLAGERPPAGGPVRVASLDDGVPVAVGGGPARLTDFGLDGDLAATFELSAGSFTEVPEYDVRLTCRNGTLANRFLPFPLSNVAGEARLADGVLTLERATGRHGETVAEARGTFRPTPGGVAGRVEFAASRVPVTAEMRPRLPEALRKLHEMLNPTGTADVAAAVLESEPGVEGGRPKPRWELRELDVTVTGGTARPAKFPYPVRDVRGTAKTDADGVLRVDFRGTAGGRPGRFTGSVVDCGKRCGFEGEVAVAGLPLDRAVRDACPPQVAAALEHLRLSGTADARLTLSRERGEDRPVHWTLAGPLTGGRVRPAGFPYEVTGLSGRVAYDSRDLLWRFTDFRGAHGPATVAGRGVLNGAATPPRLDLSLQTAGVPLDRDLRAALPDGPKEVFDLLRPTGAVEADLQLTWTPGDPVWVASRRFRVAGGTAHLTAFPLPLRDVTVAGSYEPAGDGGKVLIDGFSVIHRERTPAGPVERTTTGEVSARHHDDGSWSVRLDAMKTDGLVFGPELRAAVPQGLRDGLDALHVRGPVNLRVRQMELRGLSGDPAATTAAWDATADLTRNTAELGPTVTLHGGRVACDGQYDGRRTTLKGTLHTPRADLLDHTVTDVRAPFRLVGDRLRVGDPPDGRGNRRGGPADRGRADAYGGVVRLDADADLSRGPDYRLWANLDGLSLQTYADRHLGGSKNLRGSVKAVLDLAGRGSDLGTLVGRGKVDVEPAALGELNVVMRLFGALGRRDATMFDYAGARFRVGDRAVEFREISLAGQAISFRGRGNVWLDGRLGLEFFSQPPARWNLPLIGALSTGWVRLAVGGTVKRPRVDAGSPVVDAPLKAFLSPLLIDGAPPRTAGR